MLLKNREEGTKKEEIDNDVTLRYRKGQKLIKNSREMSGYISPSKSITLDEKPLNL
jgi:hypothetical protein